MSHTSGIWCITEEDDAIVFSVIPSSTTIYISQLKIDISTLLERTDGIHFVLWKVRFLVLRSDIAGDTALASGGYPHQALRQSC